MRRIILIVLALTVVVVTVGIAVWNVSLLSPNTTATHSVSPADTSSVTVNASASETLTDSSATLASYDSSSESEFAMPAYKAHDGGCHDGESADIGGY